MRKSPLACLAIALFFLLVPVRMFAACPGDLADVINSPVFGYEISYTNDNAGNPTDFFSDTQAQRVSDALDGNHQRFVDLTFLDPFFNSDPPEICCYDSSNIGGADFCKITLDTPYLRNRSEECVRLTAGHEAFHHVQYAYINNGSTGCGGCGGTWGKWTCEGSARMMQDQIFTDLDQDAGCITFLDEINDYLASPNISMTSASYKFALGWKYFSEQLGTTPGEPQRGLDFIETFWSNTEPTSPDSVQVLRDTIHDFDATLSLEEIFHDFTIANFTHDLDVSAIPDSAKYGYIDETPAGQAVNTYNSVARQSVGFNTLLTSSSVNAWAARYFEAIVDSSGQCEIIGFRGEATDDESVLGWTVIGIKASDRVVELHKGRGNSFYKAFFNNPADPFVKLAAVVTGLSNGGNFDYVFAQGAPKVDILRPTASRQAFVGEHAEPDRFQVRMFVSGPDILTPDGSGAVSVKGLSKDDFKVFVESNVTGFFEEAPVLTAAYVGGQYWLACQAPVADPADGTLFNLKVCMCESGPGECVVSATSRNSIIYAKLIRNQMLVIDRSGSMDLPSATPKIDAAQAAANIFVDAAADSDLLGVVSFTGDGPPDGDECNDDAEERHKLQEVNDANRITAKTEIDAITAGGWTGLGDGLLLAQKQIDDFGSPVGVDHVDHIVVLSDGMENEARCWDSTSPACNNGPTPCDTDVKPVFASGAGSDTIIDAVAFGPQTDQSLMQDIAATNAGDYFYVDVTDTASAAAAGLAAVTPADLTIGNRIAEVYLTINDRIQKKDRIFFDSGQTSPGMTTHAIPISEGKVLGATFAVNWEVPGAVSAVRLRDPDGHLIGAGDAQIFTDKTHSVFQLKKVIPRGDWTAELDAGETTQYIVTVSGKFVEGVRADLYFSQVPATRPCLLPSKFLAGLPITMLVSLADIRGGIKDAGVEAAISTPDGKLILLALFDDGQHDDGDAGDGVYGNVFAKTAAFSNTGVPEDEAKVNPGQRGSYVVNVTARGKSNGEEEFARFLSRAFQVYECWLDADPDLDGDGMPDRYEERFPCLNPDKPDADQDPDEDGLRSGEEYKLGTNPCDSDTDDGGEMDGSEVNRGADPLNPRDDCAPPPSDVEVILTPGCDDPEPVLKPFAVSIRFPVHRAYQSMILWRGERPDDLKPLTEFDPRKTEVPGLFLDQFDESSEGLTFFYRIQAVGCGGALTPLSPLVQGTVKKDPIPPKGWVTINDGAVATPDVGVILSLDPARENVEVLIANDCRFEQAKWISNPGEMDWVLDPEPKSGRKTVCAKFRDEAGNESDTYHDSILLDPSGDRDGDKVPDEQDNCPGTFNPEQEDRDEDKVGDVCDNCPDVFNPDQRDSNFDGVGDACTCLCDINGSGVVDPEDVKLFVGDYGKNDCGQNECLGDVDGDNDSDGSDLSICADEFGRKGCEQPAR